MRTNTYRLLAYTGVAALIFSVTVSYAAYRVQLHTQVFPKSVTLVTPYYVFLPSVTATGDGSGTAGMSVNYLHIMENALLAFIPSSAVAILIARLRSS